MTPIPLTDRTLGISAFDPNYLTPYTQNLTLALTRNVTQSLTLDVRYIGTLSRKLLGTVDINSPNFLNNGLLEAFNSVRNGGESRLLDDMLNGINLAGFGYGPIGTTVNGVPQTAALHMRAPAFVWAPQIGDFSTVQDSLANGNYVALANKLSFLGFPAGGYLRNSGKFPENFIKTNPQFHSAIVRTNLGHTNYHSLQGQISLRPVRGLSLQSTYTWSKNLGVVGGTFTDPSNQGADYTVQATDRKHIFVTYGTYELPIGPNHRLLGNTSGILARLLEGWQGSWIINASSGAPLNITAANMLYGIGVPDIVGDFDFDSVGVYWKEGAPDGNYFANAYKRVPDPQCATIEVSLRGTCRLQAIADSSGKIVLQNPLPGKRGTFGQNRITAPGTWSTDMAIVKSIRITEGKTFQVRVDATNIFNHPLPSFGSTPSGVRIVVPNPPSVNINDLLNPFGYINNKVGTRTFQLTGRFNF
jgi:hypothetical protein